MEHPVALVFSCYCQGFWRNSESDTGLTPLHSKVPCCRDMGELLVSMRVETWVHILMEKGDISIILGPGKTPGITVTGGDGPGNSQSQCKVKTQELERG